MQQFYCTVEQFAETLQPKRRSLLRRILKRIGLI